MDRTQAREIISERVERYLGMAATRLPDDVMTKLQEVGSKETNEMQQTIYDAYFMNLELAKKLHRPCCQCYGRNC